MGEVLASWTYNSTLLTVMPYLGEKNKATVARGPILDHLVNDQVRYFAVLLFNEVQHFFFALHELIEEDVPSSLIERYEELFEHPFASFLKFRIF